MGLAAKIHIVTTTVEDDRVISRMAKALVEHLGCTTSPQLDPKADLNYFLGYYEAAKCRDQLGIGTQAAYFTHREEDEFSRDKAVLWDKVAAKVALRIVTCEKYRKLVDHNGLTVRCAAPLERNRFTIAPLPLAKRLIAGVSGYVYKNARKGEDLLTELLKSKSASRLEWRASGRGWPVPTVKYAWKDMPAFYQGLDIFVCTSRVEGIPMPPLEALACGLKIVIPAGVGLLDELGEAEGIYRYEAGNVSQLRVALEYAVEAGEVDREALRNLTKPFSLEQWVADNVRAVQGLFPAESIETVEDPLPLPAPVAASKRGVFCVAFGEPARAAAVRMMTSVKTLMPDVPIMLCAAKPIGAEDLFLQQPDSDIGGRRVKLTTYDSAPESWETILYLDADTVLTQPVYQLFWWIESGFDFLICRDMNRTLGMTAASYEYDEYFRTLQIVGNLQAMQYNGGVWAFGRNERTKRFFAMWQNEWERWGARDQLSLLRALYQVPLKFLLLGNEWNTFPKYQPKQATAGILHYPGDARRWTGQIHGRIDSPQAWEEVAKYERSQNKTG